MRYPWINLVKYIKLIATSNSLWHIRSIRDLSVWNISNLSVQSCSSNIPLLCTICFPFNTYWFTHSMPYKSPNWTVEYIHVCTIINKNQTYTYIISHWLCTVPFFDCNAFLRINFRLVTRIALIIPDYGSTTNKHYTVKCIQL